MGRPGSGPERFSVANCGPPANPTSSCAQGRQKAPWAAAMSSGNPGPMSSGDPWATPWLCLVPPRLRETGIPEARRTVGWGRAPSSLTCAQAVRRVVATATSLTLGVCCSSAGALPAKHCERQVRRVPLDAFVSCCLVQGCARALGCLQVVLASGSEGELCRCAESRLSWNRTHRSARAVSANDELLQLQGGVRVQVRRERLQRLHGCVRYAPVGSDDQRASPPPLVARGCAIPYCRLAAVLQASFRDLYVVHFLIASWHTSSYVSMRDGNTAVVHTCMAMACWCSSVLCGTADVEGRRFTLVPRFLLLRRAALDCLRWRAADCCRWSCLYPAGQGRKPCAPNPRLDHTAALLATALDASHRKRH